MKEQSFEWMLQGCHSITEIAVAYFPNYQYDCSAVNSLRRAIKGHASLLAELTEAGFTHKTTILTPKHILALVRQWGMPLLVKEAIDKNPYLFVPKMVEKI